ncbi:hypothetical protein [Bradyrhizobium elkanii]|uniref:hypothetical protein n=1 Tax=Bradyrhizobium elkanii TaxID=29448 RepID=UPI001BADC189|nr:hypothetical protein [Bradyrhizobium elkanii]MBR1160873.1 hypothetical protein [Bradyrhizobium elkanii]
MAELLSLETQELLDAADRAIARSRELVAERRQVIAQWESRRHAQDVRLAFLHEIGKPR